VAFRQLLLSDPHLQSLLSLKECIANPHSSFVNGILEPLSSLKRSGEEVIDCRFHSQRENLTKLNCLIYFSSRAVFRRASWWWTACAKPSTTGRITATTSAVSWFDTFVESCRHCPVWIAEYHPAPAIRFDLVILFAI
jgi:hypothetical protein